VVSISGVARSSVSPMTCSGVKSTPNRDRDTFATSVLLLPALAIVAEVPMQMATPVPPLGDHAWFRAGLVDVSARSRSGLDARSLDRSRTITA